MISQGLVLMMIGMLVVFVFLSLMTLTIALLAWIFERYAKYFPEEIIGDKDDISGSKELEIVAAISAAYLRR